MLASLTFGTPSFAGMHHHTTRRSSNNFDLKEDNNHLDEYACESFIHNNGTVPNVNYLWFMCIIMSEIIEKFKILKS